MIVQNFTFISMVDIFNHQIMNFIFDIKLLNREDDLNFFLNEIFDIEKIDIIRDKVMLKKDKEYFLLSEFGDGINIF